MPNRERKIEMKKVLCMLLSIIMCISLVACGGTSSTSKEEPYLDIKQELVNICCDHSNCRSVQFFKIGTQDTRQIENGYIVSAKGTYYPIDEYGDYGYEMTFDIEFAATWDGVSSRYDIDVIKKTIKSKY